MDLLATWEQASSAASALHQAAAAPELSVVVPIRDEEESIPVLYARLTEALEAPFERAVRT